MDIAVWGLVFITVIFSLTFAGIDLQHNSTLKQDIFTSIRAANQNGLEVIKREYEEYEEITSAQMMEEWLRSFTDNTNIDFNELKLNFIEVQSEPPVFLVSVEGQQGRYVVIRDEALARHYSGALIVQEDEED